MARNHVCLGLLAAAAVGTFGVSDANAQATNEVIRPVQMQLAEGYGGEVNENGGEIENAGAGNEQPHVAKVVKDGRTYLVSVYMSSDVEEGYWQCKCSSVELTANGPQLVANNVQLTANEGGYRPCNHPRVASDGENTVVVYGSDVADPDNTQVYGAQLDQMCNMTEPFMVHPSPGNDQGAPYVAYAGKRDGVSYFVAGGHDNRGDDYAETYGLTLTPNEEGTFDLNKTYHQDITNPANVARPVIASAPEEAGGPMRALFCSSKGNQRPPEIGVECAWVDAESGEVMYTEIIAESKENEKIYYNQPSVAALSNGRFAVMVLESNGDGRKTNEKGSNKADLYIIEPGETSFTFKDQEQDMQIAWQTHAGICAGEYGPDGDIHVAVMGASITGIGQPKMQMVGWAPESGITMNAKDDWVVANYGDSGFMANIYGANPGNQGRDFLECIGSVKNPGYGVEGGFMPTVKSLFVQPIAGKPPTDPKNALFLSIIPGAADGELAAEDPTDPTDPGEDGGAAGTGDPATNGNSKSGNEQASGCSVQSAPSGSTGAAFALLGVGLLLASRRRSRG